MQGFIAGIVLSGFIALAVFSLTEQGKGLEVTRDDQKQFNALVASLNDSGYNDRMMVYLYGGEK